MRHAVSMRPLAPLLLLFAGLTSCMQAPPPADWGPIERHGPPPMAPPNLGPWQSIGETVQGRPIRYRKHGTGYRHVLWIGGIHGDEIEGVVATQQLPVALHAEPGLANRVTLHIVEDMNPDGRAIRRRTNANKIDLNRDFPSTNRRRGAGLSQPESRAVHDLILRLQPDLVIVAHSWGGRYFINFDGPARTLAHLFSKYSGFPVVPSSSIAATPGSMGSWCGWDMNIPILTLEWKRGTPPELAWRSTKEAILAVVRGK